MGVQYKQKAQEMESKQKLAPNQLQTVHSKEHNGVLCFYCNIQLPRNDWKFDFALGFVCFYDIVEIGNTTGFNLATGGASSSYGVSQGSKLYKYFRKETEQKYKCASCFVKTQAQDLCKSFDLQLQGKGTIAFPQLWNDKKCPNEITITSLQFGTRLSGHPEGKVIMNHSYQYWEKWKLQHISEDKYHLKSKTHGTYLSAFPDGHLALTTNKKGWETWIKKDYGAYHTWKSYHGNYLSCNQDSLVYLSPNQTRNECWIDI